MIGIDQQPEQADHRTHDEHAKINPPIHREEFHQGIEEKPCQEERLDLFHQPLGLGLTFFIALPEGSEYLLDLFPVLDEKAFFNHCEQAG